MTFLYWGILLGVVYIIWLFTSKIRQHRVCLSDEVIDAYRKGRLKEGQADYEHLISHLGNCENCQERMGQFD